MPILSFFSGTLDNHWKKTIRKLWKTPLKKATGFYCYWNLGFKEKRKF